MNYQDIQGKLIQVFLIATKQLPKTIIVPKLNFRISLNYKAKRNSFSD